jgi:hypothetical protein
MYRVVLISVPVATTVIVINQRVKQYASVQAQQQQYLSLSVAHRCTVLDKSL